MSGFFLLLLRSAGSNVSAGLAEVQLFTDVKEVAAELKVQDVYGNWLVPRELVHDGKLNILQEFTQIVIARTAKISSLQWTPFTWRHSARFMLMLHNPTDLHFRSKDGKQVSPTFAELESLLVQAGGDLTHFTAADGIVLTELNPVVSKSTEGHLVSEGVWSDGIKGTSILSCLLQPPQVWEGRGEPVYVPPPVVVFGKHAKLENLIMGAKLTQWHSWEELEPFKDLGLEGVCVSRFGKPNTVVYFVSHPSFINYLGADAREMHRTRILLTLRVLFLLSGPPRHPDAEKMLWEQLENISAEMRNHREGSRIWLAKVLLGDLPTEERKEIARAYYTQKWGGRLQWLRQRLLELLQVVFSG
jgi:hypothetical protein